MKNCENELAELREKYLALVDKYDAVVDKYVKLVDFNLSLRKALKNCQSEIGEDVYKIATRADVVSREALAGIDDLLHVASDICSICKASLNKEDTWSLLAEGGKSVRVCNSCHKGFSNQTLVKINNNILKKLDN